jgi:predicted aspartyl protease
MRIRLSGKIMNGEPRLPSRIAGKRLILSGKGREHMILDSGFTGSIAISEEWANRLDLRYAGIQPFELANGQIVEFPTYLGFARFGRTEVLFEFIVTGEALLGMEFFERLRARIVLECRSGRIQVEGEIS